MKTITECNEASATLFAANTYAPLKRRAFALLVVCFSILPNVAFALCEQCVTDIVEGMKEVKKVTAKTGIGREKANSTTDITDAVKNHGVKMTDAMRVVRATQAIEVLTKDYILLGKSSFVLNDDLNAYVADIAKVAPKLPETPAKK